MGERGLDWRMIKAMLLSSLFLLFPLDFPFPSALFHINTAQKLPLFFSPALSRSVFTSPAHKHTLTQRNAGQNSCSNPLFLPALLSFFPFHSLTPSHPAPIILAPSLPSCSLNTSSSPSSFFSFPCCSQQLCECTIGSAAFLFQLPFLHIFLS